MSHVLYLVPLLVLIGSVLKTSVAPSAVAALPPASPFVQIEVESPLVRAGQPQTLHVTMQGVAGQLTILTLTITYPDGATEQVVDSTLGNTATLSWAVPPDAAAGEATFRLSKGDCGCGDRSLLTTPVLPTGVIEGSFTIESPRA
jgi:hypothetical protein